MISYWIFYDMISGMHSSSLNNLIISWFVDISWCPFSLFPNLLIFPQRVMFKHQYIQQKKKERFFMRILFLGYLLTFVVYIVHVWTQISSTRKTQFWWWVRRSTRNATRLIPCSSPTMVTVSSNWTDRDCSISSVGFLDTAREGRRWSSKFWSLHILLINLQTTTRQQMFQPKTMLLQ